MIQQLPPQQCFDLLECDAEILHLDVRTPEEFADEHAEGEAGDGDLDAGSSSPDDAAAGDPTDASGESDPETPAED